MSGAASGRSQVPKPCKTRQRAGFQSRLLTYLRDRQASCVSPARPSPPRQAPPQVDGALQRLPDNDRTPLAKSQQGGKSRLYFALWLSKEGQGSCFCVALNGQTRGVGRPSHAQGRAPHQSALTEHSGFCITLKSRISACSARRHWTQLTRRGSCPWAARPC